MADVAGGFEKQFHNLEGNLIGERKKNFFKLLRSESLSSNEEHLNNTLKNLQPKTYLESLLRVDMLIYFKRTEELLRILKEGNDVFICKIIKQPWFFQEAFKNIDAEKLVNEFLPCTSFITRTKVLKRLSITLSEAQMDEVFESVLKRYGLHIAKNILHSCSSEKIIGVLSSNEIFLRPNQIKVLFNRDEKLLRLYLKHYRDTAGQSYDDESVFKYIALKNPNLLLELNKERKLNKYSLGRRTSKKIADIVKTDMAQDIKLYTSFLKLNVVVRKLGDNFKSVYLDLFPRKMEDIYNFNICNKLLQYYPKSRRWNLFAMTFSEVFGDQSVTDNLICLDSYLIDLCPEKEVKQKWAEIKYYSENDDCFIKYFEPSKAIPLIKDKINVISKNYKRLDLLKIMLDTCAESKDFVALEKVLEYFCFRHRNEEMTIRSAFLGHIRYRFQLEDLSENHWKFINQQIQILRICKEYRYYSFSIFNRKYLEFLFKNGKPFRDEVVQFVKEAISEMVSFLPNVKNPAIEKEIFTQIINVVPEVIDEENEETYKQIHSQLLKDVMEFNNNKVNSGYFLSLLDFPSLIAFINCILDKTTDLDINEYQFVARIIYYNYKFPQNAVNIDNAKLIKIIVANLDQGHFNFMNLIEFMVTRKNRSGLENQILQLYCDRISAKHTSVRISSWYLNNEPLTIVPYFDKIISTMFFKKIKLYSHFNFDTKFTAYLKNQLANPDNADKEKTVKYLSLLLSTEDFITFVESFLPKTKKLDLENEEMKQVFKLQCEVATVLRNVTEPVKMLPTVMKFCVGDYLPSALRSLYSICYRSPENQLYLYMDVLSKRAVSVRKHATFLSCALLSYDYATNQLTIAAKQSNVSSRQRVFSTILMHFLKNPSQELMDTVMSTMNIIDKNNTEMLDWLCEITRKIPKKYQAAYVEKCWEFFESMRKHTEVKVDKHLCSLLLVILGSSDILKSLPLGFCRNIINRYFKQQEGNLGNVELFVCNVLRYSVEQTENFRFIFDIISTFKASNKRETIKTFFEKFFCVAMEDMDNNYLKLFTDYWERLFTPVEMFDEYILLNLLNIKLESSEPFIENYAKGVVSFVEQLNATYSLHVHNKFTFLLKKALDSTFENEKDKFLFHYNLLKFKTTITTSILVLDVMEKVNENDSKEILEIYDGILQVLKRVEDPVVKIYYKSLLPCGALAISSNLVSKGTAWESLWT